MADFKDINLDETPCVVLACGHMFTFESLDGMMGMDSFYGIAAGSTTYDHCIPLPAEMDHTVPTCPDCRTPIRAMDVKRYGRPIGKALLDVTTKKFIQKWHQRLREADKGVGSALEKVTKGFEGIRFGSGYGVEGQPKAKKDQLRHHQLPLLRKHNISYEDQVGWVKLTGPIETVHREYSKILQGCEKTPTTKVYEAAVASIERHMQEEDLVGRVMGLSLHESEETRKTPRNLVSMAIPKPDANLLVESSSGMIELDLALFDAMREQVLPAINASDEGRLAKRAWVLAAMAVLEGCEGPARRLSETCRERNMSRKEAQMYLLVGQIQCRRLSFCLDHSSQVKGFKLVGFEVPNLADREERVALAEKVADEVEKILAHVHRVAPGSFDVTAAIDTIRAAKDKCVQRAGMFDFYQAVSKDEMEIVRAMQSEIAWIR
ncbi:hypothetical protein HDV00_011324 [Rhizophlyctis rosea]|nr:hypothetical protein HDV00_011324 [Rhizophlyctis rosea]